MKKENTMLTKFLRPRTEAVYALLRIIVGLLFAFHGLQGLTGLLIPPEYQPHMWTQGWYGSIIEIVTGLAVAAGFLTTWAAFLASGTMAVAYMQFHWKFHFGMQFFPAANQGEPALIYCWTFLYMACKGGGKWSVDAAILGDGESSESRPMKRHEIHA
ncbi:MAG: DoxX family protein [Verrucomicrobiales bacterium]|nr:DoxX family protein [Verrucomicrobiales bacterium]